MRLVRLKAPGDHKFMLFEGDVLAVIVLTMDPREILTVLQRVSDGHQPDCSVYPDQVEPIPGVELMLLPPTGTTHAICSRSGNGNPKGIQGPVGFWTFCGQVYRDQLDNTQELPPDFKLCGACKRSRRWKKAIGS